jgi:hypothetical protein
MILAKNSELGPDAYSAEPELKTVTRRGYSL